MGREATQSVRCTSDKHGSVRAAWDHTGGVGARLVRLVVGLLSPGEGPLVYDSR
jgi:hypothetical protein